MTSSISLVLLTALALSLVSCGASAFATIQFEPYSYEFLGETIDAELGRLTVPERHSEPDGERISLAFLRLKSTSQNPGSPIIYLAGGPGGSGIDLAKSPRGAVFLAMRAVGDVIALDQRGTGLAEPKLTCPGSLNMQPTVASTPAAILQRWRDLSASCVSFWRKRRVDLTAYNVVENAHDLDSLRRALGAEKINLLGSSYGTHLGLAALRHHGGRIHRAVFAAVEGPDHTYKLPSVIGRQLQAVDDLIDNDVDLRRDIPDFVDLVEKVVETAERKPFEIAVADDGEAGKVATIVLGRFDLEQLIMAMLGHRENLERLPGLLLALDHGDLSSPLVQVASRMLMKQRTGPIGLAMSYAMDCASGASKQRVAQIAREAKLSVLESSINFPLPELCGAWGIVELPAAERTVIHSDVPVLFVSGTLDGRTPPSNAQEVLSGFPNGAHVLIEGSGHGHDLFVGSPEIKRLMVEFIKAGRVTTNRIVLPPLQFRRSKW